MYQKIVDMNDILRKSDVDSRLDYQLLFGKGAHAPRNNTRVWRKSSLCLGLITATVRERNPRFWGRNNTRERRKSSLAYVESSRQDQTQLDSASEGKEYEPITSDA